MSEEKDKHDKSAEEAAVFVFQRISAGMEDPDMQSQVLTALTLSRMKRPFDEKFYTKKTQEELLKELVPEGLSPAFEWFAKKTVKEFLEFRVTDEIPNSSVDAARQAIQNMLSGTYLKESIERAYLNFGKREK